MTRTRWLWPRGEDGGVAVADPLDLPFGIGEDLPGTALALRVVSGERPRARRGPAAAADHGRELPGTAQY